MNQLFLQNPFNNKTQIFRYESKNQVSIQSILNSFASGITTLNDFRLTLNGKQIQSNEQLKNSIQNNSVVRILFRLRGGKGGFGSQLKKDARAQKKITNWDLSRDLQGRRVRDINNEKKLVEFFKKQKDEQEQVDKEIKEYKDMQKEQGNQNFGYQIMNNDYKDRIESVEESISNSVLLGMQKQKNNKSKPSQDQQEQYEKSEDGFLVPKKIKKADQNIDSPLPGSVKQEEGTALSENSSSKSEKQLDKVYDMPFSKSDLKQEEISQQNLDTPIDQNKLNEALNNLQKQPIFDEKKLIALGEIKEFDEIELNQMKSIDDLINLGDAHLKNELTRLGLKAGGKIDEKAGRLWAIKQDPQNLFNPKYMAKKK